LREACRSCAHPPVALHWNHTRRFEQLDRQVRERTGCVLSCEACSMNRWKPVCRSGLCQARPAESVSGAQ
jgi:hypothetical protein